MQHFPDTNKILSLPGKETKTKSNQNNIKIRCGDLVSETFEAFEAWCLPGFPALPSMQLLKGPTIGS